MTDQNCPQMFAGSLPWLSQERHKREAVGGDTIRPWASDAGCSIMLITCPSRISFLRILPPSPAALICLFISHYNGTSARAARVIRRSGFRPIVRWRLFAHHHRPLTQPRGDWFSSDCCRGSSSRTGLLKAPGKHIGVTPIFSPALLAAWFPASSIEQGRQAVGPVGK